MTKTQTTAPPERRRRTADDAATTAAARVEEAVTALAGLDDLAIGDRAAFDAALDDLTTACSTLSARVDQFASAKRSRQDPVDLLAKAHALRETVRSCFDRALCAAVDSGVTLTDIAGLLGGVSRQRAGQIVAAARERVTA